MTYKREMIDSITTGHIRRNGTQWPIESELVQVEGVAKKPYWVILINLCDGVADGSRTFQDKKTAMDAWYKLKGDDDE